MSKPNRKCCVCGEEYYYCSHNCRDNLNKPSWLASFCSENCKQVYEACSAVFAKQMTYQEAKKILDTCDLSNKDHFTPATQKLIEEIYTNAGDEIIKTNLEEAVEKNLSDDMNEFKSQENIFNTKVDSSTYDSINKKISKYTNVSTNNKQTNKKNKKR